LPSSDTTPLLDPPNSTNSSAVPSHNSTANSPAPATATVASNNAVPNAVVTGSAADSNTLKASMTAHQRSQSLSGLQVLTLLARTVYSSQFPIFDSLNLFYILKVYVNSALQVITIQFVS
jgi:hypothetical protein